MALRRTYHLQRRKNSPQRQRGTRPDSHASVDPVG